MKRKITYFLIAMLSMSMAFVSCKKDEDPLWKKVPTVEIKGENVVSIVNGRTSTNGSIQMNVTNGEQGTVSLNNLIFGYENVDIDVALTEVGDSFDFTGETTLGAGKKSDFISSINVKVNGNITLDGKATVNVSTEAIGGIVDTWSLPDSAVVLLEPVVRVESSPILLNWPALHPDNEEMKNGQQLSNVLGMVAPYALCEVLNKISFNADGSIVAAYYPTIILPEGQDLKSWFMGLVMMGGNDKFVPSPRTWITSPASFASWSVKGDYLYVLPNIEMIVKTLAPEVNYSDIEKVLQEFMAADDAALQSLITMISGQFGIDLSILKPAQLREILTWTKTGVPLKYRMEDDLLYIYADKKMVAPFMSILFPMLPMLQAELDKLAVEDPMMGLLPVFLGVEKLTDIETIWNTNTTDVFELGIMLKK